MKTIVICSGGLDSVTLAYKVAREHELLGLVSFDYGQRHKKKSWTMRRLLQKSLVCHIIFWT